MANWKYTIDLQPEFGQVQDEERTIRSLIPIIVERFRVALPAHLFEEIAPSLGDLSALVVQPNPTGEDVDGDDFDEQFQYIYDWCDQRRIWIKTLV